MTDDRKEPLSCSNKSFEYSRCSPCLLLGAFDLNSGGLLNELIRDQIVTSSGERRIGIEPVLIMKVRRKIIRYGIVAVNDKHHLRIVLESQHPLCKSGLIRVTRYTLKLCDFRPDLDRLSEQMNLLGAFYYRAPESSYRLISDKQYGTLLTPQIVL